MVSKKKALLSLGFKDKLVKWPSNKGVLVFRYMCKSKIHRATVTGADLNYVGSITIDKLLMEAADLLEYEQVHIVNNNNGARFTTYVIAGKEGSGVVCLNGAASRLVQVSDVIIVLSFVSVNEANLKNFEPEIIYVDHLNKIIKKKEQSKLIEQALSTSPM